MDGDRAAGDGVGEGDGRRLRRRKMATEVGVRVQKDGAVRDADLYRLRCRTLPPGVPERGGRAQPTLACRHKSPSSPSSLSMISFAHPSRPLGFTASALFAARTPRVAPGPGPFPLVLAHAHAHGRTIGFSRAAAVRPAANRATTPKSYPGAGCVQAPPALAADARSRSHLQTRPPRPRPRTDPIPASKMATPR